MKTEWRKSKFTRSTPQFCQKGVFPPFSICRRNENLFFCKRLSFNVHGIDRQTIAAAVCYCVGIQSIRHSVNWSPSFARIRAGENLFHDIHLRKKKTFTYSVCEKWLFDSIWWSQVCLLNEWKCIVHTFAFVNHLFYAACESYTTFIVKYVQCNVKTNSYSSIRTPRIPT